MNRTLEKAQDIFLEKINQICREFGLNNIMAQLYVILYMSNKPLSLDDMVERLSISKGSASVNIRALERYGVVRRVWVKRTRKDYYEAETDISKVILDRIRAMADRRLSEVGNMINSIHQVLDESSPKDKEEKESVEVFKHRLDNLKNLYERAQSIFDLFNSGMLGALVGDKKQKNAKREPLNISDVKIDA